MYEVERIGSRVELRIMVSGEGLSCEMSPLEALRLAGELSTFVGAIQDERFESMSDKRDRKLAEAVTASHTTQQVRMADQGPAAMFPTPKECPAIATEQPPVEATEHAVVLDVLDAIGEQLERFEGMLKVINHNVATTGKQVTAIVKFLDQVAEPAEKPLIVPVK